MARKSKTNKNVVIIALIVMLLLLAVGYATFSDILTISGTANAKGTFDLQFQNAQIIKAVGVTTAESTPETVAGDPASGLAGANVTSATISEDKNTLNVKVADLAYPGAGVEFSVDIVNTGSISAKVNELIPKGLEGNDIIKIEGLDQITKEHPTIKSGETCNIHFIVYWPETSTAVLPEEGTSVNFSLGIEYTQSDDNEMFTGKPSHDGNVVETDPVTPVEKVDPEYEVPGQLTATSLEQTLGDLASQLPDGFSFQDSLDTKIGDKEAPSFTFEGNTGYAYLEFYVTYTPDDIEKYNIIRDIPIEILVTITLNA